MPLGRHRDFDCKWHKRCKFYFLNCFVHVELNLTLLMQTDVKKLKDAGIHTIAALTMNTREVGFNCLEFNCLCCHVFIKFLLSSSCAMSKDFLTPKSTNCDQIHQSFNTKLIILLHLLQAGGGGRSKIEVASSGCWIRHRCGSVGQEIKVL